MNCLTLPEGEHKPIGIWGQRHKKFLKEHRKSTYTTILMMGKLNSYFADIDEQAQERLDTKSVAYSPYFTAIT